MYRNSICILEMKCNNKKYMCAKSFFFSAYLDIFPNFNLKYYYDASISEFNCQFTDENTRHKYEFNLCILYP